MVYCHNTRWAIRQQMRCSGAVLRTSPWRGPITWPHPTKSLTWLVPQVISDIFARPVQLCLPAHLNSVALLRPAVHPVQHVFRKGRYAGAVGALAAAALAWKQEDFGYYERLMAAASALYPVATAIPHSSCAGSPRVCHCYWPAS